VHNVLCLTDNNVLSDLKKLFLDVSLLAIFAKFPKPEFNEAFNDIEYPSESPQISHSLLRVKYSSSLPALTSIASKMTIHSTRLWSLKHLDLNGRCLFRQPRASEDERQDPKTGPCPVPIRGCPFEGTFPAGHRPRHHWVHETLRTSSVSTMGTQVSSSGSSAIERSGHYGIDAWPERPSAACSQPWFPRKSPRHWSGKSMAVFQNSTHDLRDDHSRSDIPKYVRRQGGMNAKVDIDCTAYAGPCVHH